MPSQYTGPSNSQGKMLNIPKNYSHFSLTSLGSWHFSSYMEARRWKLEMGLVSRSSSERTLKSTCCYKYKKLRYLAKGGNMRTSEGSFSCSGKKKNHRSSFLRLYWKIGPWTFEISVILI